MFTDPNLKNLTVNILKAYVGYTVYSNTQTKKTVLYVLNTVPIKYVLNSALEMKTF